jgi:hypothetical protein
VRSILTPLVRAGRTYRRFGREVGRRSTCRYVRLSALGHWAQVGRGWFVFGVSHNGRRWPPDVLPARDRSPTMNQRARQDRVVSGVAGHREGVAYSCAGFIVGQERRLGARYLTKRNGVDDRHAPRHDEVGILERLELFEGTQPLSRVGFFLFAKTLRAWVGQLKEPMSLGGPH